MRTTTAYFAGVGTVAVAIAAGLGGGLLFANMVAPHQPKYAAEPTKLEQRMADRTIPVSSAPSEPVPYLAATQPAATTPVAAAAPAQGQPQAQTEPPAATPPVEQQANNAAAAQPAASTPPTSDQIAREPAASPREAFAKARGADIKRAATEKRRAERHQQWADKRRVRQPREQELEAVEQSVRDATEPRQAFMAEPARLDTPRIRLFGDD
ncbi:hypothetical protein [Afipia sp. GAS231]|uniref:hypothetical protein n=1 Tax=Afipia sp. GAS231 TaxID=1882747 RepID=UPI00087A361A|nr:hypothetical protein [Afipia sp. GAS231]SDO58808.1 hypothetical protein SAMN05444050_4511 [Afipia sp. GAS231]